MHGYIIKKVKGADAAFEGAESLKFAQSTIKILRNLHFSPDLSHFSIKAEVLDQVGGAEAPTTEYDPMPLPLAS